MFAAIHVCKSSMHIYTCVFLCVVSETECNLGTLPFLEALVKARHTSYHIPKHLDILLCFSISYDGCFL